MVNAVHLPPVTLREVLELYLKVRRIGETTKKEYRSKLQRCVPDWLDRPIKILDSRMIIERHAELTEKGPIQANRVAAILRALCEFSQSELVGVEWPRNRNPVQILSDTKAWNKERSRIEHFIAVEDVGDWFVAVNRLNFRASADLLILLLFTGLRYGEARQLTWDRIDLANRFLSLKSADTKNGQPHILPLPEYLVGILLQRSRAAVGDIVFEGLIPGKPITSVKRSIVKVERMSGVRFTVHDLRRTFINLVTHPLVMYKNGDVTTPPLVSDAQIKALLNHVNDVTRRHYLTVNPESLRYPMEMVSRLILKQSGIYQMDIEA